MSNFTNIQRFGDACWAKYYLGTLGNAFLGHPIYWRRHTGLCGMCKKRVLFMDYSTGLYM